MLLAFKVSILYFLKTSTEQQNQLPQLVGLTPIVWSQSYVCSEDPRVRILLTLLCLTSAPSTMVTSVLQHRGHQCAPAPWSPVDRQRCESCVKHCVDTELLVSLSQILVHTHHPPYTQCQYDVALILNTDSIIQMAGEILSTRCDFIDLKTRFQFLVFRWC